METNDIDLAEKIAKNNDSSALDELFVRHLAMFRNERNKLPEPLRQEFPDSEFLILIWKAARSYKFKKKTKFSTWLYTEVRFARMACYRKFQKTSEREEPLDLTVAEGLPSENQELQTEHNLELVKVLKTYLQNENSITEIKPREKRILRLRYLNGKDKVTTFKEIGKSVGLSTWGCVLSHNKAIETLKKNLKLILQD